MSKRTFAPTSPQPRWLGPIVISCLVLLQGCAATPGPRVEYDPWERYNRAMFKFNEGFDRVILKPVATAYDKGIPRVIKRAVSNFYSNLNDVVVTVNDLLQLKGRRALTDGARLVTNTTIGIFGLIDVARLMGLEKNDEDFGQTLGYWGVGSGPYLVLPFLGPATLRDGPSLLVDARTNPLFWIEDDATLYGLIALGFVEIRAGLLGATSIIETAAIDPYAFTRDAYLQRRRNLVYDGNPPLEELDELDLFEEEAEPPLDSLDRLESFEDQQPPAK